MIKKNVGNVKKKTTSVNIRNNIQNEEKEKSSALTYV